MKKLFTILAVAAAMVSCAKEDVVSVQEPAQIAFEGVFVENATRANDPSTTTNNNTNNNANGNANNGNDMGNDISNGVSNAGNAVGDVVDGVGEAASDIGKGISNGLRDITG